MPVKLSESYKGANRRFIENHPEAEERQVLAHLGSTALSEEAQQHIVDHSAPEIAHHPRISEIAAQPEAQHVALVSALHEAEQSGPSDNEQTDKYLRDRGSAGKRESRAVLQRKGG
jgi:hypothetical protein